MSYNRRRVTLTLLTAALTLTLRPAAHADPPHKHALLIGISKYSALPHVVPGKPAEPEPLFGDLNCDEDLARIQATLVKKYGFDPKEPEMVVLSKPAQTTRTAILAALERVIAQTQPGDLVYVHYSGHGSRLPDATKPDGYETTIVPSDYKDDQSGEISGKELGAELAKLKSKGPGQVVLSFDCCHSGTATRGSERRRGLTDDEYAAWYARYHNGAKPPKLTTSRGARGADTVMPDLEGKGYVILSACTNDQSAYEYTENGKGMGRLSYVLSQVLSQAGPRTTYQQIYDQIKATFAQKFADQSPQLDGDPNTYLLGGTAQETPPSILVSVAASGASGHYTLDAGSLQGMTVGSEFAIYAKSAAEFTEDHKLAEAKIESVDMTTADMSLSKKIKADLTADSFQGARAVETAHDYAAPALTLDAASVRMAAPTLAPAILQKLAELKMVRMNLKPGEKADVRMAAPAGKARGTSEVDLVRGDTGDTIKPISLGDDAPTQVYKALKTEARYRYAVGLGLNQPGLNSEYHVALRLVPAESKKDGTSHTVFDHDKPLSAASTLRVGDYFTIEVQNTSPKQLFLTVLDIGSDGEISQPWPAPKDTTQANIIMPTAPRQWVKLWRGSDNAQPALFHATSADPHEIYKALATDQYVSFKALLARGTDRGPSGPFSDLFGPAVDEGTRGTNDADPVDPGSWTAATYPFQVQDSPAAH